MASRLHYALPIARTLLRDSARRLRGGLTTTLPQRPGAKPLILVAGAGRSGTSAVARVLHESGVHMGDELGQASDMNPEGFYEDMGVWRLHERLFTELGLGSIWRPGRWPWRSTVLAVAESYRVEMAALVAGATDGWKEPRFALTLEAWLPLFATPPKIVVCLRSPQAYAESVTRLFGLVDIDGAQRSWAHQNRRLLDVIGDYGLDATCVEYNQLVERPEETVERLARFAGRPLDARYVEPSLRRYEAPVPERYRALYREVLALDPEAAAIAAADVARAAARAVATLAPDAYVAQIEQLIERTERARAAWLARVEMPDAPATEETHAATSTYSAALLESQEALAALAPPQQLARQHALAQEQVNLQRLIAEVVLAAIGGDDPKMRKAVEETWRSYGRPEAFERRQRELLGGLEETKAKL